MIFHLVHHLLEIPVTIMIGSRIVENCDMFIGITFVGNVVTYMFNYLNSLFYFLSLWCISIIKPLTEINLPSLTVSARNLTIFLTRSIKSKLVSKQQAREKADILLHV